VQIYTIAITDKDRKIIRVFNFADKAEWNLACDMLESRDVDFDADYNEPDNADDVGEWLDYHR